MVGDAAASAAWYAPEAMVPGVPITATWPVFVTFAAACAPGMITPITGMGSAASSAGRATAEAVLQATTSALMSYSNSACGVGQRVAGDDLTRLGAVGNPRRVAQVDGGLQREALHQRLEHREPADTRVEDANRRVSAVPHAPWQ